MLAAVHGLDPAELADYRATILERFRNPAIGHKLSQIAWDGSQKLPYRILDTVAEALAAGRKVDRLAVPVAAWMLFVERKARSGEAITDPLAEVLAEIASGPGLVDRLLDLRQVFRPELAGDQRFRDAVERAVAAMRDDPRGVLPL